MNIKKDETTITGNVVKKFHYEHFPETKKSILTTVLIDDQEQKHFFKAFNRNAERIKQAIEEGITKFTLIGQESIPETDTSKKELLVNELQKHKVMTISGKITKMESLQVGAKKIPITEILLYSETVPEPGKVTTQSYNITIWPNTKAAMPKDLTLEKGQTIAVKGEATIFDYKTGEQGIKINAWNVDANTKALEKQIEQRQQASKDRNAPQR